MNWPLLEDGSASVPGMSSAVWDFKPCVLLLTMLELFNNVLIDSAS